MENLSDCPVDTRPTCWNGERVENLSDCPVDTRPICWNGERVEKLADCPTEYCWSGTCNIGGTSGGSCGIATQTAAQSAYNTFRNLCPKSDIVTNIFEVTQWYADVTCNNGTKFTLGPATSSTAAATLGQGGLLACSASGSWDAMGLAGRTLTRSELRDSLRAHLKATASPTNIDDLLPEGVMVGDHPEADIRGAKAFGMRTIWKRDEYWDPPGVVDAVITDLEQLPATIRALS